MALISWKQGEVRATGWALLWPVFGAVIRGFAQAGAKAGLLLWPNPFAASLIGYMVSTASVTGLNRMDRSIRQKPTVRGVAWFALTGVLNGGAVLLMYAALNIAPVSLVAPVVAAYPLVTVLVSAAVLREEPLTRRMLAGVVITVLAIVYLVSAVR
jgi:drug/metabolite transporter (DMT)-like permease